MFTPLLEEGTKGFEGGMNAKKYIGIQDIESNRHKGYAAAIANRCFCAFR